MKTRSFYALPALAALAAGLAAVPAGAQTITITSINPQIQTTVQGGLLTFSATVKNNSATDTYYFLGDNADFTVAPGPTEFGLPAASSGTVALDDTPFTAYYGTSIAPNATQTYALFAVAAGTTATVGSYTGYFTLQGGTDPNGVASDLVTQNFRVNVSAVPAPEPSQAVGLTLFSLLVAGKVVLRRRARVS